MEWINGVLFRILSYYYKNSDGNLVTVNGNSYGTHQQNEYYGTDYEEDTNSNSLFATKYASSTTFRNYVRESVHRYLYVTCNYSAVMNGVSSNTRFIKVMTWWQIALLAVIIVFFVLALVAVVLTVISYLIPVLPQRKKKFKR